MCVWKEFECKYVILKEPWMKRMGKWKIHKSLFIDSGFFDFVSEWQVWSPKWLKVLIYFDK